jgi:hypothetical protein
MPPTPLPLSNACIYLRRTVEDLHHKQIMSPDNPDRGALVSPEYGMADPKLTGSFIVECVYLLLASEREGEPALLSGLPDLIERANLATDFMLRAQRPSGLIDLLSVNYDSSPDTGFTVEQLCTLFELGRDRSPDPAWATLLDKLERFIRRAVAGMLSGGFHTPNHRWVMVSAMVHAQTLFPDLDVRATVEAYLAEGFDIDTEGTYIERSVGVYDAVNNRSLLFIAEHWNRPDAVDAVASNLHFDLHLLHADGTAETGLSRRQDYGTREVAIGLAPYFLLCNHVQPEPIFAAAAQWLWNQCTDPIQHIGWLTYALLKCGKPEAPLATLPDDFVRHYPLNGIWRVRRNLLSTTLFRQTTRLLTFTYGAAELSSVKISQTYFGQYTGRFVSDELTVNDGCATLLSRGMTNPRRPAYELPLGRPVPPDRWSEATQERELRRLPPAVSTLSAREAANAEMQGLELHYRTLDGLDRVAAQVMFDFPPGGVWETNNMRTRPDAGQVIFLDAGHGRMRYGNDVISIGPGHAAHGMWQMRDSEPAPEHVRVIVTFVTPVDHHFQLLAYRGLDRE